MKIPSVFKTAMALLTMSALAGCPRGDALKMVTNVSFPPYEFMRGDEIVGVDIEICRAVAKRLGKDFCSDSVEFDAVLPTVVSGKADLAAAGITVTEKRKKNVDFSIPYVKTGVVVVFRRSVPFKVPAQLKGRKVGVQNGTTSEQYVLGNVGQEPVRYGTLKEAVEALKLGFCDFVLADIDPAKNSIRHEPDLDISDFITSEEYAIAVRKGRADLLKAVNDTISELKANGTIAKWMADFTAESDAIKD